MIIRSDKVEYQKHWLHYLVPWSFQDINWWMPWQVLFWALLGNDHDGPLGTAPTSGSAWIEKYKMEKICLLGGNCKWNHGEISLKRLLLWNLRNPLHNLFFFVLGITWMENITQFEVLTIGETTRIGDNKGHPTVWPMGKYGFSIVLRQYVLPFIAVRINIPYTVNRIEFYLGWRERGALGAAFRIKTRED